MEETGEFRISKRSSKQTSQKLSKRTERARSGLRIRIKQQRLKSPPSPLFSILYDNTTPTHGSKSRQSAQGGHLEFLKWLWLWVRVRYRDNGKFYEETDSKCPAIIHIGDFLARQHPKARRNTVARVRRNFAAPPLIPMEKRSNIRICTINHIPLWSTAHTCIFPNQLLDL